MTFSNRIVWAGTIAGSLTAIGALAAMIGWNADRPAWSSELVRLAGEVKRVEQLATEQALESSELRQLRIEQEIEDREAKGQDTGTLPAELKILKRRTRKFQLKLDKLEAENE